MKKVGISSNYDFNKGSTVRLDRGYFESAYRLGVLPVILSPSCGIENIDEIVSSIDGLILLGGLDVSPFLYGENPNTEAVYSDERDDFEIALYKEARRKKIPVLGICRGLQLINVIHGGSLIRDIVLEGYKDILHVKKEIGDTDTEELYHFINLEESSNFFKFIGEKKIVTNTIHHQAIKNLGQGLKAAAKADDGIIEAIESEDDGVFAVQFHPERDLNNPVFRKIFEDFVRKIR